MRGNKKASALTNFRGIEGDRLPPPARSPAKAAHIAEISVNGLREN